jgi:hypothetical protein
MIRCISWSNKCIEDCVKIKRWKDDVSDRFEHKNNNI